MLRAAEPAQGRAELPPSLPFPSPGAPSAPGTGRRREGKSGKRWNKWRFDRQRLAVPRRPPSAFQEPEILNKLKDNESPSVALLGPRPGSPAPRNSWLGGSRSGEEAVREGRGVPMAPRRGCEGKLGSSSASRAPGAAFY